MGSRNSKGLLGFGGWVPEHYDVLFEDENVDPGSKLLGPRGIKLFKLVFAMLKRCNVVLKPV